jgi:DNA invertase Pin-like site-specific DNA recombinase
MALIGYARVSTAEQDTALQTDALRKAGCERVFEDTASGAKADRPGLADALAYLRDGDVLAVWRLDRLGRSMPHLIETIGALEARGVGFRSLTEAIDTTTPGGRLIFHVFGALGQFERDLIRERTKAGLTAACRFQKTAALNVRSRLHYSSGGVGSIRQRRAAAGHQRTQGGLSATGRSMRHRWPSRRGSESARIDLRCPTSH